MKKFLILALLWTHYAVAVQDLSPKSFCDEKVSHTYYQICYSTEHRQAFWTFHKLTRESIKGPAKRRNNYRFDPEITNPVDGHDYRRSGFDRGHMVPAADMKLNAQAMSETFYMSNMSPQRGSFNQRIWAQLERGVREMVISFGDAWVVTVSKLEPGLPRIASGVSIPTQYFKIAYFPAEKLMRAYAFENKGYPGRKYSEFQVTVDEVEKITGHDFYAGLPDNLENLLESELR